VAIVCHALIAVVLALTGTFAELAVLSTLAIAPLYIGGSVAAWRLARRGVAEAGAPLKFRWLGGAMIVASVSMLALIALASRAEITGLLVVMVASVLGYLLLRWRAGP
jgi:basic amino acid/polyamine antiporter, APA family